MCSAKGAEERGHEVGEHESEDVPGIWGGGHVDDSLRFVLGVLEVLDS